MNAGTEAEAMDYAFLPDPPDFLGLLSYTAQCHLPRVGTVHSGLGPPASILTLDKALRTCLQATLNSGIFSVESPTSQRTRVCFKLTKDWPTQVSSQETNIWLNASELERAEP